MLSKLNIEKEKYKYFENNYDFIKYFEEIKKNYYLEKPTKMIYFTKKSEGEIDSLFKCIRNSFAHGNFFKKGIYIYLWDKYYKHIRSFIVLRYCDLKRLFDLLEEFKEGKRNHM